jgi:hypothetical protein
MWEAKHQTWMSCALQIDLAGTHAGTLYGKGAYFSECSSKGDEYTNPSIATEDEEPSNIRSLRVISSAGGTADSVKEVRQSEDAKRRADSRPVCSMLLCRVCLGNVYRNLISRPDPMKLYKVESLRPCLVECTQSPSTRCLCAYALAKAGTSVQLVCLSTYPEPN